MRSMLSLALLSIVKEDFFLHDLANFQDIVCRHDVGTSGISRKVPNMSVLDFYAVVFAT